MGATLDREALVGVILGQARAVLDRPQLLPDEDFFEAGGDSILAVEMVDRLGEMIGAEIPVAFLYTYPTAVDLAGVVEEVCGRQDGTAVVR